jgi:hypothetical protein
MKKENLIGRLEGAKLMSSQVDIDKVIELIQALDEPQAVGPVFNEELIERVCDEIEGCLNRNSDECVDIDSAEFSLNYDNRIELERIDLNVYEIMQHVSAKMRLVLEAFELEAADEEAEAEEEGTLRDE